MGFTKNGRKILGNILSNSTNSDITKTFKDMGLIDNTGLVCSGALSIPQYPSDKLAISSLFQGCNINSVNRNVGVAYDYRYMLCLGASNTKETLDDYTLESVPLTSKAVSQINSNDTYMIGFTNTVTNETDSTVTVKEIGLGIRAKGWKSSSSSTTEYKGENCLLFRKVLDSPVTIQPDETYTFTLVLK